jgi:hypothetical protein
MVVSLAQLRDRSEWSALHLQSSQAMDYWHITMEDLIEL